MLQGSTSAAKQAAKLSGAHAQRQDLIARSGFFDAEWYRGRHPDAAESDLDPVDHYLIHGVRQRLDPGPLFAAGDYLRHAWHLRPGYDDPLEHFLLHGEAEGRVVRPAAFRAPGATYARRTLEPLCSGGIIDAKPSVAASVHAFHSDIFGELSAALSFLPPATNILVITDDEWKAAQFAEHCRFAGVSGRLSITVTRNRGRNFGPMLVEHRNALLQHDLMLHVHTKKADYRGREQRSWRGRLLRSLLPSRATVASLIGRFVGNRSLGILIAAPGDAVRYWAYNWLSNEATCRDLLRRLNVMTSLPGQMFDYPVGGMFWARTDAIRPLLEYVWSWEDFPGEDGQLDGTVAHAIERLPIILARSRGYEFGEIDYLNGTIRRGWSDRGMVQYWKVDLGALQDTILQASIVSFSTRETLFQRNYLCERHVEEYAGYLASRRGHDQPRGTGQEGHRDEHDTRILTVQQIASELRERLTSVRGPVVEASHFARAHGKRIIVIVRNEAERSFFQQIADGSGMRSVVDTVYDAGRRMWSEDAPAIWRTVIRNECIQRVDGGIPVLVHVGSDARFDIQATADLGVRHFHVMGATDLLLAHGLYHDDGNGAASSFGDSVLLGPILTRIFSDPFSGDETGTVVIGTAKDLGYCIFGPMLFSFLCFVIHRVSATVGTAFFLSREGWFLGRSYAALARMLGRTDLPTPRYFHCSRRCVLSALQADAIDVDALLQGAGFRGTMREFMAARLGLHGAEDDVELDRRIRLPGDEDVVRRLLDRRSDLLVASGCSQRAGLAAYRQEVGMVGDAFHPFIDIGYSATVQDALQRLGDVRLDGLYMGVSHAAGRVTRRGGRATGHFASGDADLSGFTGSYGLLLEAFLTAPHGQVIGYGNGQVAFRSGGASQQTSEVLERVYQGLEDYMRDVLRSWGTAAVDVEFDHGTAMSMLRSLHEGRIRLAPDLSAALSVEDDFCGMGEIRVLDDPPAVPAPS